MAAKTVIKTPFPSTEEVAAELGVTKTRVRELRTLLDTIIGPEQQRGRGRSLAGIALKKRAKVAEPAVTPGRRRAKK
jgi:hypothetical protein